MLRSPWFYILLGAVGLVALLISCVMPESVKPQTSVDLLSPTRTDTVAPTTHVPTSQTAGGDIIGSGNPTVTTTIGLPWEDLWKPFLILVVWDTLRDFTKGGLRRRRDASRRSAIDYSRLDG